MVPKPKSLLLRHMANPSRPRYITTVSSLIIASSIFLLPGCLWFDTTDAYPFSVDNEDEKTHTISLKMVEPGGEFYLNETYVLRPGESRLYTIPLEIKSLQIHAEVDGNQTLARSIKIESGGTSWLKVDRDGKLRFGEAIV